MTPDGRMTMRLARPVEPDTVIVIDIAFEP
jgi:hypothetical protein